MSVIDFATRKVDATWPIPGGGSPDMGNVSADGKLLWLSGRYDNVVYAIDTSQRPRDVDPGRPRAARPHGLAAAGPLLARPHRQHALARPAVGSTLPARGARRRAAAIASPRPATMLTSLVVTVIGPDRPGLVRLLSDCGNAHGASWEESRMASLAGQFAGMVRFAVDSARAAALAAALTRWSRHGLRVVIAAGPGRAARTAQRGR